MLVWILALLLIAPSNLRVEMLTSPLSPILKPTFAQIAALNGSYLQHPRYRGVVGHWIMAEGGGTRVRDISGFGNDGTMTNMDPATDWVIGRFGTRIEFDDASDEYVDTGSFFPVSGGNARSVSAWVKTSETATTMTMVEWGENASGKRYRIGINSGTAALRTEVSGAGENGTGAITDGVLHHVVVTQSGPDFDTTKIYLDGVLDKDFTTSFTVNTGTVVGIDIANAPALGSAGGNWDGLIDNVIIWNRALNASEIWSLYTDPFLEFRPERRVWKAPAVAGAIERPAGLYHHRYHNLAA